MDAAVQGTDGWFQAQIGRVNTIADTLAYEDYTGARFAESEAYLANCITENPVAYAYYYGLPDDRCVFSDGWEVPSDYRATERDWYPDAYAHPEKTIISSGYVDADTGRIVVTISKAIVRDGEVLGVFAADFFVDDLISMVTDLSKDTSFAILIDKDGNVITHRKEQYVPKVDEQGDMIATHYSEIGISEALIAPAERTSITSNYIYDSEYLEDLGFTIIFATNIWSYYGGLLIFCGVSIVLMLSIYVVTNRKMLQVVQDSLMPLDYLSQITEEMQQGNLGAAMNCASDDEIGSLCATIEKTNLAIKGYIDDISEKLKEMSNGNLALDVDGEYVGDFSPLKDSINQIIEAMNAALGAITASAEAVYETAANVHQGADSLAHDVEQATEIVCNVESQIEEIQESFTESSGIIEEVSELSLHAINNLQDGNTSLKSLVQAIDNISEKSDAISEIINIINVIASQTNLLALNASIEAARVGELGKGFAVVAEEVKKLSEETTSAAAQTSALILETHQAVAVGKELAGEASGKMNAIISTTTDVNQHIQRVYVHINNEKEMVAGVKDAITNMNAYVSNTQAISEECVALSSELDHQANQMKEAVNRFALRD